MKLNFCTLFDSNYLSRGLTMYESLTQVCSQFHLFVFAFDKSCYDFLKSQHLEHLTVISLEEFEDVELLKIKSSRSQKEYCWTCTPSTILYCINTFSLDHCTYIDADLYFYSDPGILIDEMKENSVLITSHRYTKVYDQSKESGKYCVQFVTFRNDEQGKIVLNWWRNACIEWCYAKVENGKFGDQKYLDDWKMRFKGVHELHHLGGGVAPWNVQQYKFHKSPGSILGTETSSGTKFNLVFYHFHGVTYFEDGIVSLSDSLYELNAWVIQHLYRPYIRRLNETKNKIAQLDSSIKSNGAKGKSPYPPMSIQLLLKFYRLEFGHSKKNIFGNSLLKKIAHHYYYASDKL